MLHMAPFAALRVTRDFVACQFGARTPLPP
jgi:hypothetical protein